MRQQWRQVMSRFVACVLLLGVGACAESHQPPPPPPPPPQLKPATSTSEPPRPPGSMLSAEPASDAWRALLPPGANANRIVYRSTSGVDGTATDVSGVVLTPAGPAPEGGWPIITVGHGLTAAAGDCGPSAHPELTSTSKKIIPLVKAGYLVVMSDYQGLSEPGTHPFLDPKTAAHNLIDAVAAARQLVPQHSNKWAAWGHSQGGQAAWAALEHAKEYGKAFQFVGAVAMSPAVDDTAILDAALAGTLTKGQESLFPDLIEGYLAKHPDGKWEDFLSGVLLDQHDVFTSCAADALKQRAQLTAKITPGDVVPSSPDAQAKLRQWLQEVSLPTGAGDGPLLVVQGGKDDLVRPEWVHEAVTKGCSMGMTVQEVVREGVGHDGVENDQEVLDWLADRFSGQQPAPTSCE